MRKASFIAALLLLAPTFSQAKTLEDLLVEKGVITKGEAVTTTASESGPAKVYYNEGTRIDFPDAGFTAQINTMIQARYGFYDEDEDAARRDSDPPVSFNGAGGRVNRSSFDVHRARISVSGTALYQEFAYMVEGDFVGTATEDELAGRESDNSKNTTLKDAWIQWQPCQEYATRIGQFRNVFSRQSGTHDAKQQFADRSVVSEHYGLGRMQGINQSAALADGKFVVNAGIFNGTSDLEGTNASGIDTNHLGVVGVRFNPTGTMDPSEEGDVNHTEDLATTVGLSYVMAEAHNDVGLGRQEDTEFDAANADFGLKYKGFSLQAEYYWRNADLQHDDFDAVETNGGYIQAGLFLKPKTWEIAGRYGYLDCDNGRAGGYCEGNDNVNEAAATINYYWWKHQLKAQLGYYFINEDRAGVNNDQSGSDANTNKWLFQLSSYF